MSVEMSKLRVKVENLLGKYGEVRDSQYLQNQLSDGLTNASLAVRKYGSEKSMERGLGEAVLDRFKQNAEEKLAYLQKRSQETVQTGSDAHYNFITTENPSIATVLLQQIDTSRDMLKGVEDLRETISGIKEYAGLIKARPITAQKEYDIPDHVLGGPRRISKEEADFLYDKHQKEGVVPYRLPGIFMQQFGRNITGNTAQIYARHPYEEAKKILRDRSKAFRKELTQKTVGKPKYQSKSDRPWLSREQSDFLYDKHHDEKVSLSKLQKLFEQQFGREISENTTVKYATHRFDEARKNIREASAAYRRSHPVTKKEKDLTLKESKMPPRITEEESRYISELHFKDKLNPPQIVEKFVEKFGRAISTATVYYNWKFGYQGAKDVWKRKKLKKVSKKGRHDKILPMHAKYMHDLRLKQPNLTYEQIGKRASKEFGRLFSIYSVYNYARFGYEGGKKAIRERPRDKKDSTESKVQSDVEMINIGNALISKSFFEDLKNKRFVKNSELESILADAPYKSATFEEKIESLVDALRKEGLDKTRASRSGIYVSKRVT